MSDTPPPPLSAEARRVLEMVRDEPIDDAQVLRVRRRVAGLIGVSALAAATSTAKAASALTTKLVVIGTAAVVAVGVTTYVATKAPDAPPPVVKTAPVAPMSAPTPSVVVLTVPPPPSEPPPAAPASTSAQPSAPVVAVPPPAPTAAPSPPADTLAAERALLATAQQELSAKNYRKARDTYEHHLAEYPFGALRLEAAVGRVVAMCGMKDPAGQVEAPKLLAKNLPAALANRVRGACGIE